MWTFQISHGVLRHDDVIQCRTCYSGYGADANQPADESIKDLGPLPEGGYTIGTPIDLEGGPHGPYVLPLTPNDGHPMYGRSGFACHGDRTDGSVHLASHGCLIAPRATREQIGQSGDNQLEVIA